MKNNILGLNGFFENENDDELNNMLDSLAKGLDSIDTDMSNTLVLALIELKKQDYRLLKAQEETIKSQKETIKVLKQLLKG